MTRTALRDRSLPAYTRGEEIFNMVTHIVGGGVGVITLLLCVFTGILSNSIMSCWPRAIKFARVSPIGI